MISIENLLNMVLEDAVERGGEPEDHYFDESKNPNFEREKTYFPKIKDNPELIKKFGDSPY